MQHVLYDIKRCQTAIENAPKPLTRRTLLHVLRGFLECKHQNDNWGIVIKWNTTRAITQTKSLQDLENFPAMSPSQANRFYNKTAPIYLIRDGNKFRLQGKTQLFVHLVQCYIYDRWFRPYRSEIEYWQFLVQFVITKPVVLNDSMCSQATVDLISKYNAKLCAGIIEAQKCAPSPPFTDDGLQERLWIHCDLERTADAEKIKNDQVNFILQPSFHAIAIVIHEKDYLFDERLESVTVLLMRTGVEDGLSAHITFDSIPNPAITNTIMRSDGTTILGIETAITFLLELEQREIAAFGLRPDPSNRPRVWRMLLDAMERHY